MSRPKKYENGFHHLDLKLPAEQVRKLEDFCGKMRLTKTDAMEIAINYMVMSCAEREEKLKELAIEVQRLGNENSQLKVKIESAKQKERACAFNPEIESSIKTAKKLREVRIYTDMNGRIHTFAEECDKLRGFLDARTISPEQRQRIIDFFNSLEKTEMVMHEHS